MKIKFWGVRGSLPGTANINESKEQAAHILKKFFQSGYKSESEIQSFLSGAYSPDLTGYGVATTCVQVINPNSTENLIIDGGSGIKYLSDEFAQGLVKQKEFHILMTHFHFDHILGLPFFVPHFVPGCKVTYYSVQPECEMIVRSLFKKPIFPVGYDDLKADIQFKSLKAYEKNKIQGFDVTPYKLDHPDPCYGFRIEKDQLVYAHAVDTEAIRTTEAELGQDAGLYKKADLLYIDAQYLEDEMIHKKGWGHGTFERAFNITRRFGIKQVLMAHYDPSARIADIQKFKEKASEEYKKTNQESAFKWEFAYEGQIIELKK